MQRISLLGTTSNGLLAGIRRTASDLRATISLPHLHAWNGTAVEELNRTGSLPVAVHDAWRDEIGMWRLEFLLPYDQTTTGAIMFLDEIAAVVARSGSVPCDG